MIKVEPEEDEISNISTNGSFRVSAVYTNTGYETFIDVNWYIILEGDLILVSGHSEDCYIRITSRTVKTIRQTTLYGIRRTTMTITAGDATIQATCFFLGQIVLGLSWI